MRIPLRFGYQRRHEGPPIRLWLDEQRPPWEHGHEGWAWAKTSAQAAKLLGTGRVIEASLSTDGPHGYALVCWMEEHGTWPPQGVGVRGADDPRMQQVIERHYGIK